jgi:hypothetical protein
MDYPDSSQPVRRKAENLLSVLGVLLGVVIVFFAYILYGGRGAARHIPFFVPGFWILFLPSGLLISGGLCNLLLRGHWRWLFFVGNMALVATEIKLTGSFFAPISIILLLPILTLVIIPIFALLDTL